MAHCLNGAIGESDATELNRLVALDPAVAREFALAMRQESNLETAYGPESEERMPVPARARRTIGRRVIAVGAAASAAAAMLLLLWSWRKNANDRPAIATSQAPQRAAETLRFADGSTAELQGDDSRLDRRSDTLTGIDLALVKGAVRFEVVPRAGRRFRVWVGALHVDVVGTIFTVARLPSGVRVAVERGAVKVTSGKRELDVTAGSERFVAVPEPPSPAVEPAAGTPRLAGKRDEPGALLKASEVARHAGRLEEARELLERLLDQHPRDPRSPYAAFILGRVLLDELDRPRDAAAAFARVRVLDPRTPLAPDALAREAESWFSAGDKSRASAGASEYLSRYPDGRRKDQVRRYSRLE